MYFSQVNHPSLFPYFVPLYEKNRNSQDNHVKALQQTQNHHSNIARICIPLLKILLERLLVFHLKCSRSVLLNVIFGILFSHSPPTQMKGIVFQRIPKSIRTLDCRVLVDVKENYTLLLLMSP